MEDFGAVLRQYRQARGLSTYTLAKLSGVNSSSLSRFERGRYRPRPQTLGRLAKALDVPYEELRRAAGYPGDELPRLRPYLRVAYGMDEAGAADVERYVAEHYGSSAGPSDGEDEYDP